MSFRIPQITSAIFLSFDEWLMNTSYDIGSAAPNIFTLFDFGNPLQQNALGMVFDIAPDGERIIVPVRVPRTASRLHIVVNWFEELLERVGN